MASALKDAWAGIVRERGAGPIVGIKTEDIKSKLLGGFRAELVKQATKLQIEPPRIEVKPEFEALRTKLRTTLEESQLQAQQNSYSRPQDSMKQYIFGLNVQRARSVSPLKPNTDSKKQAAPVQIRCIDDIYRLEDSPFRGAETDSLEDRFEIYSIASKKTQVGRHIEDPQREISFLADISPIARFMANMRADEEQMFYEGVCPIPGIDASGCVHMLEADCDQYFNDEVEFDDVLQFVMGRLPRQKLYSKVATLNRDNPTYQESWRQAEESPLRRASEQHITVSHIQSKPSHMSANESIAESKDEATTISITVPPDIPEEELEQRLMELIEDIRNLNEGKIKKKDFDKKLQAIINQVGEEGSNVSKEKQSLRLKMLITFITAFRTAKEKKQHKQPQTKPLVPRRPQTAVKKQKPIKAAAEVDPEDYLYTRKEAPKATKMKGGWGTGTSPAILNSRYAPIKRNTKVQPPTKDDSKWIGGLKNSKDLEGDWIGGRSKTPL
mmetsp:Transcript_21927/g.39998  ORF Transcript_21927/g.39998 Transcript_21927/m.39998 type:complete len:498 (-) Transcript_21927:36-1529(-)